MKQKIKEFTLCVVVGEALFIVLFVAYNSVIQ